MKKVSIVVPAHNEEKNVALLFDEVRSSLEGLADTIEWELIFVNDGSRDGTAHAVRDLMAAHPNVRLIQLSRNFGHQAALMAGLNAARGDAVVCMDCDLQHPPKYIAEMVQAWERGALVVEMKRLRTKGIAVSKNLLSMCFYKVINQFSTVPIHEGVADFRLLDHIVVAELIKINDPRPFIRGLIAWLGFKSVTISYVAEERRHGEASYTLRKSLRLAHQALMSLAHAPMRFSIYVSLGLFCVCALYIVYVLAMVIRGDVVAGWPSVIISVLAFGAVQMMALGVLGEYIAQIFERTRCLPAYVALPEERLKRDADQDSE